MNEPKTRGTGRTERMIKQAVECAVSSGAVVIVVNSTEFFAVRDKAYKSISFAGVDVVNGNWFIIPNGGSLRVIESSHFDFNRMSVEGFSHQTTYFLDHDVIKRRFRKIIELYHAYDAPRA